MKLAVIPARGGSKRIPRKNIKSFSGKPMIAWTIEAAKRAGVFDTIIVSTDDEEIAEISSVYGATVPFMRPEYLSDDYAATTEVIAHAISEMNKDSNVYSDICCLYATAPFISSKDIKSGLCELHKNNWDFVFSASEFAAPIFRSFIKTEHGGAEMLYPEHFKTRSQDLPMVLHDAGQFYWGRKDSWLRGMPIFSKSSHPLVIPRWRVQDIDTIDDWRRAELMSKSILQNDGAYPL